jgi:hypothetical protein
VSTLFIELRREQTVPHLAFEAFEHMRALGGGDETGN